MVASVREEAAVAQVVCRVIIQDLAVYIYSVYANADAVPISIISVSMRWVILSSLEFLR